MKKNFTLFLLCVLLSLSFSASAQNSALSFDGGAGHFVTTSHEIIQNNFTVEFWAYVPTMVAGRHEFISQGFVASGSAFYIGYDGSSAGDIIVGDFWGDTGIPLPFGKWVHIAVVYDNGNSVATLYLNGVQAATSSALIDGSGANLQIGAQTDGTEVITGRMDELRIWEGTGTTAGMRT